MSTLTIDLPEEDLLYLKTWTASQGKSVENWVADQARALRQSASRPLHLHVEDVIGILPADLDGKAAYGDYLEKKYR